MFGIFTSSNFACLAENWPLNSLTYFTRNFVNILSTKTGLIFVVSKIEDKLCLAAM